MITVAKYKHKYFKDICGLTDAEWDMGKTMGKTRKLWATKYYYCWLFKNHPRYDYVLLDDGKCIGYIAIADIQSKQNIFKRMWYWLCMQVYTLLMGSPSGFRKFWHYYDFIPSPETFGCDAEVLNWIVHKDYRKNHNGKYLWTVAMAQAKHIGMHDAIIYTDNTASFWVYDLLGAERVLERDVVFNDPAYNITEHAIMYKYKIQ